MKMSFLLGAGFSRPAGYPLASELGAKVMGIQASGIATHTDGRAWLRPEFLEHLTQSPEIPFPDPHDGFSWPERSGALALESVLSVYIQQHPGNSDYEAFYDELYAYKQGDEVRMATPAFQVEYEKRGLHGKTTPNGSSQHIKHALDMAFRIFPQLLHQLLVANPAAASINAAEAYQRFFGLLRTYGQSSGSTFWNTPAATHDFCLHTLNHDLFVEDRLSHEGYYGAIEYCDGFSEMGSPYYGRLEFNSDFPKWMQKRPRHAYVRMPRYTDEFSGPIQLLKLHGSLDYYSFGVERNDAGLYEPLVVRKQSWIDHLALYREVSVDDGLIYRNDFTNYHPLFLSGTTAKLEQYSDPILFSKLLSRFEQNLVESDILVIIGYGFCDKGINECILPFLENENKRTITIGQNYPTHFSALRPDMFRAEGLEGYDFGELEQLLQDGLQNSQTLKN